MGIIRKIADASHQNTTYRVGLLQSRAYRALKNFTDDALKPYGISSVEWAFLGALLDAESGLRTGEAADILGVEAPFVTVIVAEFSEKGLIEHASDPKDGRAKIIRLAPKGRALVPEIEKSLRGKMRPLIAGVSPGELLGYLTALQKISDNHDRIARNDS